MSYDVRESAACLLEQTRGSVPPRALVGFDGFVDTITSVVERRNSMKPDDYEPVRTIEALGKRIAGAAGRSTNIELRAREVRGGGNGPLLAGALAALGIDVTLIGALGREDNPDVPDKAYEQVVSLCSRVVSIAPSARTDALEFDDGKIMFNWSANLDGVDWTKLVSAVPDDELLRLSKGSELLATVNWTNMGGLGSIWRGLLEHVVLPLGEHAPAVFVDISDPAKRGDDDLVTMLDELRLFSEKTVVTLGLNIAEAERLCRVLGVAGGAVDSSPDAMLAAAEGLLESTGLGRVVVHTRSLVAAADCDGDSVIATKTVDRPVISTGAGDHFNGGYLAGRLLGLPVAESLACGCDAASRFVRTGLRPTRDDLIDELRSSASGAV